MPIEVQADHLDRLAKCSPASALGELIWNALDADATSVAVTIERNNMDGVQAVRVDDNGGGIGGEGAELDALFGKLGGSWKARSGKTAHGRALHGRSGEGRFKSFALGARVVWRTRVLKDGRLAEFSVSADRNIANFTIEVLPDTKARATGTCVVLSEIDTKLNLSAERILEKLTPEFALYLQTYPDARVSVDGREMRPEDLQVKRAELDPVQVTLPDGTTVTASVSVIEWNKQAARAIYLCDEQGFALHEVPVGIQAKGFYFTAYLRSSHFEALQRDLVLDNDLAPGREKLLDAAKKQLREYFRKRTAEEAKGAVTRWKAEAVYPYDFSPANPVEEAERQVFDIVALTMTELMPELDQSEQMQKRLTFRLVREALAQNPNALTKILGDVVGLPPEKQNELAELLKETTLSEMINASKVVTDRLKLLKGVEDLLFDFEQQKRFLERTQLHRILAANTWIFGEEYALTVDDESLNAALERHLALLGRDSLDSTPVLREDGKKGVLDLMLSRSLPLPHHNRLEHLVVELKRPTQDVDGKVVQQVKDYAFAVAADERFRDTATTWRFVAVSNVISPNVQKEAKQKDRPLGLIYEDSEINLTIWVFTWGQIFQEARARLEFFRRALNHTAGTESARAHLKQVYARYLPTAEESDGTAGSAK